MLGAANAVRGVFKTGLAEGLPTSSRYPYDIDDIFQILGYLSKALVSSTFNFARGLIFKISIESFLVASRDP